MAFEQNNSSEKFQTTDTSTEQQRESMQNLSAELMSKPQRVMKTGVSAVGDSGNGQLPKVSIEDGSLNFQKCSDGGNFEVIKLEDVLKPFPKKKEIVWDDGQDWGMGPKLSFGQ